MLPLRLLANSMFYSFIHVNFFILACHGGSRAYSGNTLCEVGIHPGWDTHKYSHNHTYLVHLFEDRTKPETKPTQTCGEHVKHYTDSNTSSGWSPETWSCEVAPLPAVPLCHTVTKEMLSLTP